VPHILWHGASVFAVSSEGPPHSVASRVNENWKKNSQVPTMALAIWRLKYRSLNHNSNFESKQKAWL
jgi:hypothetical protein